MSSSVFTETSSARVVADADSNLVVVYGKNGISFDERAIENLMEEKSISTISVVRITSPTPSMLDQEEVERLEELERFLDTNHSDGDDSENEESDDEHGSQTDRNDDDEENSDGVEIKSEMDHVTGDDDEDNSSNVGGGLYNGDSTETETEAVRVKKRPGRKPKKVKKRKRRKPKERPQVVGLSVEQFYAETTADIVVKNALKLAGLSIFKRTPETDALLEIIKNDHNYTPFTSPEQMRNHKSAERMAMERQAAQGRKLIMQAPPGNIKLFNAKRRIQANTTTTTPGTSTILVKSQKHQQQPQPKEKQDTIAVRPIQKPGRNLIKIISPPPVEDNIEDDEHAFSSDLDTEEISEESEESRDSDNDRDSDMDFNISRSNRVSSKKKQRIKVPIRRAKQQQGKQLPPATSSVAAAATTPTSVQSPVQQQQQQQQLRKKPNRVLVADQASPKIGQIIQLPTNKAPPTVIALGRNMQSTSFLKMRPAQQQQQLQPHVQVVRKTSPVVVTSNEIIRLPTPASATSSSAAAAAAAKVRRIPMVQVGRVQTNPTASGVFTTAPPQEVKEIVINKNISSPKGVFTNLNSLLGDNSKIVKSTAAPSSTPDRQRHMQSPMQSFNKGFMPIGVTTASTHKLPAQIVIETHQSSSELAAENDKQLDLINSIVQDELLKSSLIEQPPVNVDDSIPKLVKMLESTAEDLDQTASNFEQNQPNQTTTVDNIDISNARLLETPDEDEITADFLQHVVGLIEEDKQFEAEVVKQVLASTELDLLNAVPALEPPVPILQQAPDSQLTDQSLPPMASSTPSRSTTIPVADPDSPRPDTKIVRGNGRIIYLPPIEAPTTRAKRRAQNTSVVGSMDQSNISLSDYVMDSSSSSISNELVAATSVKRTNPREPSMARRSAVPRRSHTKMLASQTTDAEASESQEDDDDPNKLWCICRQPHNNRFMICCDLCEDWYHGTCVNVTKAMGLEMEQKGIDWKCPKCLKKREEMSQPRITDMLNVQGAAAATIEAVPPKKLSPGSASPQTKHLIKRLPTPTTATSISPSSNPPASQSPVTKVLHQQQLNFIKLGASSGQAERTAACVVCKRAIRPNSSVYCSDDCIRKYAQAAMQQQTPQKTQETPAVLPLSPTSTVNLSHDTKKNKKKDLFEDVLRQADISMPKVDRINVFERRSGRALTGHLAPTTQQLKKWLQDNPTYEVLPTATVEKRPIKRSPPTPETTIVVKPKALAEVAAKTDPIPTTQTILNTPVSRKEREKEKAPVSSSVASPVRASSTKSEPIRVNVRRTLKEQLLARIKEAQEANTDKAIKWLTSLEVEQFARSVESEIYHSFGRDAGAKYKSKYRSLMFNIKDRKNKTLFEKICAKQVEPKQLVRMTPEQLASQELAKWREEENRHQLDMIKKSELDMLSCTQNYLVNTHKGEEVIDPKVEVTLPDEEAQAEEKQVEVEAKISQSHSSEADGSLDRSSSKEKRHRSQKHHHHHRHHHQRNRSRSRSHSRSRSLEKRHRRHPHNNDSEKADGKEDESVVASPLAASSSPLPKKIIEKKTEETPTKPLPTYNLIDQILESEKTVEQAANLKLPTAKQPNQIAPTKVLPTTPLDKYVRYVQGNEAWSTPLWSGHLHMVDVADFQVIIHPIHGNCQHLSKFLPNKLDVIGRITRVNVWEYIKKIKKSPTKEIIIVNLFPQSPSETFNFDQFYEYLDSRQRLGVLGTDSDQIRDFYIFPLGSKDHLPSALQTADRVPFYEDTQRPNTLLGIIVKCLSKRTAAAPIPLNTSANTINTSSSSSTKVASKKSRSATTFTPPTSPKRKRSSHSTSSKDDEFDIDAIIKAPIAKLQKVDEPLTPGLVIPVDDPNEPYSPGGSSDDDGRCNKGDLERQVQEINKQIAAQQKEIAGLLNVEPSGKPTTSSNILAGISIPPNLSKILASIKESSDTQATSNALNSEEYNPEDAITTTSSYPVIAARKGRSRLAQLSEAELLSMVPDNMADVAATPSLPATSNTKRYQHQ